MDEVDSGDSTKARASVDNRTSKPHRKKKSKSQDEIPTRIPKSYTGEPKVPKTCSLFTSD